MSDLPTVQTDEILHEEVRGGDCLCVSVMMMKTEKMMMKTESSNAVLPKLIINTEVPEGNL